MTPAQRRELTDRQHRHLSIVRQCQLMGVSRSSLYYRPKETSQQDLSLMQAMDRQYLGTPFYGSRRMKASLDRQGLPASRKRVQRLMRLMGLRAIYRQPRTSQPAAGRWVYPYLLRDLTITRANQVWAADITYLPMARGFLYLVAIMDWHSRYVVAWGLSNTLETGFCAEALGDALNQGTPDMFNTDQGSQFTSREFTQILQDHSVKISMDGRGRYQDNILVERLWRTVKYEEVYLKAYANGLEARNGLREYFRFYNHRRPHQALGYRTPAEVFHGEPVEEELKERRCPDQPVLVSYGGVFSVNYFCRFRQLFLPVHPLFLTALLGHSGAVAGDVEFQDDRVVDHPVDGRSRGHWVGEDVLPLGEDQVGRDAQGPAFVAFGDEREEHLGLLGPLGQVPQVVQQQEVVVVELS